MLISGSEHLISFVYFSGHNLQNTEGLPVSSGRKEEEEEKKKKQAHSGTTILKQDVVSGLEKFTDSCL